MDNRSLKILAVLLLVPGVACAEESFISVQGGIAVVVLQLIPFAHILWTKKLASCYKTGYCMLYLAIFAISWLIVAIMAGFFPNLPNLLLRLPLLLPILFWIYTFTLGKDVRESEQRTCQLSTQATDTDQS